MSASSRTRIKFCGMTSAEDVRLAVDAGADALGFIFAESPRRLRLEQVPALVAELPPLVTRVAVVTEHEAELVPELLARAFTVQFSGHEPAELCERLLAGRPYLKAFHMLPGGVEPSERSGDFTPYRNALWMFDTFAGERGGGAGVPFDWSRVAALARTRPIVVAGGLSPENVGRCVRAVRPYAVDVRSGVERGGKKDIELMRAFVRAVREADAET
jgi:phosphoribosylanthranilate isomerase